MAIVAERRSSPAAVLQADLLQADLFGQSVVATKLDRTLLGLIATTLYDGSLGVRAQGGSLMDAALV